MANLSVSEVYDDFRTTYQPEPDFTIDFHNKNAIFFNNYKSFVDGDELSLYIELTGLYIAALYSKDRYSVVIDEANRDLKVIDEAIEVLKTNELKTKWYYDIIFVKGMAHYRLQEYKNSLSLFKRLVGADPKNENYLIWLKYAQFKTRAWIINIMYGIFIVLIVADITFKPRFNKDLRFYIDSVGFIGITILTFYEMSIKRSFRKMSKS